MVSCQKKTKRECFPLVNWTWIGFMDLRDYAEAIRLGNESTVVRKACIA